MPCLLCDLLWLVKVSSGEVWVETGQYAPAAPAFTQPHCNLRLMHLRSMGRRTKFHSLLPRPPHRPVLVAGCGGRSLAALACGAGCCLLPPGAWPIPCGLPPVRRWCLALLTAAACRRAVGAGRCLPPVCSRPTAPVTTPAPGPAGVCGGGELRTGQAQGHRAPKSHSNCGVLRQRLPKLCVPPAVHATAAGRIGQE